MRAFSQRRSATGLADLLRATDGHRLSLLRRAWSRPRSAGGWVWRPARCHHHLRGRHQVINACTAIHIAEQLRLRGLGLPASAVVEGLKHVDWPGRLEMMDAAPPLLLDGAHNPAGARSLRAFLDEYCPVPVTLIFGAMADKAIAEIAAILFPTAGVVIATRLANERAAAPALIAALAPDSGSQVI